MSSRQIYPTETSSSGTTPLKYTQKHDVVHFSPSEALRRSFLRNESGVFSPNSVTVVRKRHARRQVDSNVENASSGQNSRHSSTPSLYESLKKSIIHHAGMNSSHTSPASTSRHQRQHSDIVSASLSSPTSSEGSIHANLFNDTLYLSNGLKVNENEPMSRQEQFMQQETTEMKQWIEDKSFGYLMVDLEKSFAEIEEEHRVKQLEKKRPETRWTEEDELRAMEGSMNRRQIDPLEYSRIVSSPQLATELSRAEEGLNASYQYASPDHRAAYRSSRPFGEEDVDEYLLGQSGNLSMSQSLLRSRRDSTRRAASKRDEFDTTPRTTHKRSIPIEEVSQNDDEQQEVTSKISHRSDSFSTTSILDDLRSNSPRDDTINISHSHKHDTYLYPEQDSSVPYINSTRYILQNLSVKDSDIAVTRDFSLQGQAFTVLIGRNNVGKTRVMLWIKALMTALHTNRDKCLSRDGTQRAPKLYPRRITRVEFTFAQQYQKPEEDPLTLVLYQSYNTTLLITGALESTLLNALPDSLSQTMQDSIKALNDTISINFMLLTEALRTEPQSTTITEFSQSFDVLYCDFSTMKAPTSLHSFLSQFNLSSTKHFQVVKRQLFKRISSLLQDCRIEERIHEGEIRLYVSNRLATFAHLSESYRKLFQLAALLFELETRLAKNRDTEDKSTIVLLDHVDSLLDGATQKRLNHYLREFVTKQQGAVQMICAAQDEAFVQNKDSNASNAICVLAPEGISLPYGLFSQTLLPYFTRMQFPLWKQIQFVEKLLHYRRIVFVPTREDLVIIQTLLDRFFDQARELRKCVVWIVLSDFLEIGNNKHTVDYKLDAQLLESCSRVHAFIGKLNHLIDTHVDIGEVSTTGNIAAFILLNGSLLSEVQPTAMLEWKRSTSEVHQWSKRSLQNQVLSLKALRTALQKEDADVQDALRRAYNSGAHRTGDAGVYQDIVHLISQNLPEAYVSDRTFQNYLAEKDLSMQQVEALFGDDANFVLNSMKSRLANTKKNQQVMLRVEQFMLRHQLPIHLSAERIVDDSTAEGKILLQYIHVPSLLMHLLMEGESFSLASHSYLRSLERIDGEIQEVFEKLSKFAGVNAQ